MISAGVAVGGISVIISFISVRISLYHMRLVRQLENRIADAQPLNAKGETI
jgi:hypothetical protein